MVLAPRGTVGRCRLWRPSRFVGRYALSALRPRAGFAWENGVVAVDADLGRDAMRRLADGCRRGCEARRAPLAPAAMAPALAPRASWESRRLNSMARCSAARVAGSASQGSTRSRWTGDWRRLRARCWSWRCLAPSASTSTRHPAQRPTPRQQRLHAPPQQAPSRHGDLGFRHSTLQSALAILQRDERAQFPSPLRPEHPMATRCAWHLPVAPLSKQQALPKR